MKKLLFTLLIIPFLAVAQEKGISFEHQTNWDKVKAKAKAENKHIFVDCFTTWCGPCKYMSSTIFPQEKVGDFFNANFVNLKLQMDQTKEDSDDVKSWYQEADRFAKDYSVQAYPTFLIFSPEGELVHRIVGGGEADDFIAKAQAGLDPETQYVTLVKKFEQNPQDAELAKKTAKAAMSAYDQDLGKKATARYIDLVGGQGLLTAENIQFLSQGATSSTSPAFILIKENKEKVDELLGGKGRAANDILAAVLINEIVIPEIRDKGDDVDFATLKTRLEKEHPYVDTRVTFGNIKAQYFFSKKNWPAFKDAVNDLFAISDRKVPASTLNSFAWSVFENCDDAACIQAALNWSKQSLEGSEEPAFLDTYANLLYKSGDKENAIKYQEKAVAKASDSEKENYVATLDKMKKGEQTW
ncbi:thioredoxin family protein [Sphingobacterium bambusae]|uniref:Thioredoxin fold domain-containing protein n=1 Tax=Sphingobacterium bambusae TaxID=662858 RepID=A0ABW6BHL2_9SPHI|nr:thioredoxin fold domain-containing protein [Sphingobacterium bambusae]WPL50490.1 thioredoxin fold domain-containing protein [Sphingobacterium bambusae]